MFNTVITEQDLNDGKNHQY